MHINLVLKIQQRSKNKDQLSSFSLQFYNGKRGMPGGTDEETRGPSQGTRGKGHRNPTKIIPYLVEPFLVSAKVTQPLIKTPLI